MTSTRLQGRPGSARTSLFGYAVLRANYNHNAPNYLDNFTGFVLDVLAQRQPEPLDENAVGQAVRESFGLTIPDRVAGLLLKRAVKSGKAETQDRVHFSIKQSALTNVASLEATIREFEDKQVELLAKFLDFVGQRHPGGLSLVEAEPDRHLHSFIEQYAAPLIRRAEKGRRTANTSWSDLQGPDYLVGAFILDLAEHDAQVFGYLVDAAKGAILTGVLDLGPGDLRRNLRSLTIILDTPVLLKGLGYQGEAQQRAVQQTLDLAHNLGVKTVCFEHTQKEIDGVLESVVPVLRGRGRTTGQLRAVDAHFLDMDATPVDILLHQSNLHQNLQRLAVRVIDGPDDYYQYGLDEASLDDLLKKYLPTQREATRRYDVQSLSAVHRLRRGSSPENFEQCGHVLATDNHGLVAAGRHMGERHGWPLAMLDSDVAALLWVRSPAVAEDLPREQLLATVYAGMQPGSHLWMRYVEEIERLEVHGDVDEDEAVILRSRPEARRALMDVTLGEADNIDTDSIGDVVQRVRGALEGRLREELDMTQTERDQALLEAEQAQAGVAQVKSQKAEEVQLLRDRVDDLEQRQAEQERRIEKRCQRRAAQYLYAIVGLFALALVTPAALQESAPATVAGLPSFVRIAALAGGGAIFFLAALRHFYGGSLKDWLRPLEARLAKWIEGRARKRAGLFPAA